MKPLHPETVKALAHLVCGDSAPPYRKLVQIGEFLQRADRRFPDPDGRESRFVWTCEQLNACNHEIEISSEAEFNLPDLNSLEAVILQLADQREYQGDRNARQNVFGKLNQILGPEGLSVVFDGIRPCLQQVDGHVNISDENAVYPAPDFAKFIDDQPLILNLRARWEEARRCLEANAYLATIILLGSILEGALSHTVRNNPGAANKSTKCPRDRERKPKPFREWTLNECIAVAHDCGWIQGDRLRFSHALRESRNLVHPYVQLNLDERPDNNSCRICWEVVQAAIDDLSTDPAVAF